jgi:hypothetical protein
MASESYALAIVCVRPHREVDRATGPMPPESPVHERMRFDAPRHPTAQVNGR